MKKNVDKVLGGFLVILMAVMTIDVLWGVFTRYVFNSQADWTEELARFLLMWIGILGAAYASGMRMHLAIDLLKPRLSRPKQLRLAAFVNIMVAFFALFVMVVGGSRLLYITSTLGQNSAALRLPMTVVYSVLPLSGLLVIFYKLNELANLRMAARKTSEME